MKRFVLDAWALLALLQKEEPAASQVRSLLQEAQQERSRALVSVINLGEVYYVLGKATGEAEAEKVIEVIRRLPVKVVPASDERVFAAARLKIHHPLSYADAFAAATADEFAAILVTGDPELVRMEGTIHVQKFARR